MATSVTIKDIALHAAVSVGTVSRVFNNHSNVTEDVRQRVLKAAATLGYAGPSGQRNATQQASTPQMREIGFLFSPWNEGTSAAANPYWSLILAGVEQEATRANIKLTYRSIRQVRDKPRQLQDLINEMNLDGLLLVGFGDADTIKGLKALGRPLVLVSNYIPHLGVDAVIDDGYQSVRQTVEYLIDEGHRKIAFVGGPTEMVGERPVNSSYPIENRLDGYRVALLNAGIQINYNLYEGSNLTPEGGYEACKLLLKRGADFTALVCSNDSTAIGASRALAEAGLKIPQDVSVVGFGDYLHTSEQPRAGLTTVRVDFVAMGAISVQRLISRYADPNGVASTSLFEGELVKRGSVRTLNH